ncbi:MAG: MFS transporter [Dehalococcoidales bacterium]|nr:MFS transporter [Dehalococcoidales bacterium]
MKKFSLALKLYFNIGGLITLLSNLALETSAIFLPLFAQDNGASTFQIGIMGSAYGISNAVSSLIFSREADKGRGPLLVRISLGIAVLAFIMQSIVDNPIQLILIRALIGFCFGISSAALVAYNFAGGRSTGQFASLGSLGWLIGAILAIFFYDYQTLFRFSAASCSLAFIISLTLKARYSPTILRPDIFKVIRRNIRIYLPFLFRQLGANMVWVILPLFFASIGANKTWIAILSGINTGGQFIFMMFVEKIRESRLFIIGLLVSAAIFLAYSQVDNYLYLIPIQIILSFAWSSLYVGSLLLLLKNNTEKATSTGLLITIISISATIGPILGGFITQNFGYEILMYVALTLCLVGFVTNLIKIK